jgi:hypothetical protein
MRLSGGQRPGPHTLARAPISLFQPVKDITVAELRAIVSALARIATLLNLPIITTASVPEGPNGRDKTEVNGVGIRPSLLEPEKEASVSFKIESQS